MTDQQMEQFVSTKDFTKDKLRYPQGLPALTIDAEPISFYFCNCLSLLLCVCTVTKQPQYRDYFVSL